MSDDLPFLPARDDPMSTKVELLPQRGDHEVLVNGLRVPLLTATEGRDTMTLILDGRLAVDVPIELAENVIGFVANVIAVERGYGCWPRVPDEHDQPKAPTFGPIFQELDSTSETEEAE